MAESNVARGDTLEKIPTPDEVRISLSRRLTEVRLLRQLLRIAEKQHGRAADAPAGNPEQAGKGATR